MRVRNRCADGGFTVTAHAANLADADAAKAAAEEVIAATRDRFRGVHAVVCAAGGFGNTGPLDQSDPAAWHKQFTINLDTAFGATRAFLPACGRRKVHSSTSVPLRRCQVAIPPALPHTPQRRAVCWRSCPPIAKEERANGVRANAVVPTQVRTAANIDAMGDDKAYVERESVADVVAFLASPLARNVTGQAITLA